MIHTPAFTVGKASAVSLLSVLCLKFRFPRFLSGFLPLRFHSLSSTPPARQTVAPSIAQSYQCNLIDTDNSSNTYTSGSSLLCLSIPVASVYCGQIIICGFQKEQEVCLLIAVEKA